MARKRLAAISVLMLLSFIVPLLAACGDGGASKPSSSTTPSSTGPTATAAPTGPQGKIVLLDEGYLTPLDPHQCGSTSCRVYTQQVFETLYERDENAKLVPLLATSYNVLNEGKDIEVNLRQGVKFHNGDPFTAEDVKFSVERILDPEIKSPYTTFFKDLVSMEIVSPYKMVFHLKGPDALFMSMMAQQGLIVPAAHVKKVGNAEFANKPVGTGPYKVVRWAANDFVEIEANMDYWNGPPPVKTFVLKEVREATTRVAMLRSGEADLIRAVPPQMVPELKASSDLRVEPVAMAAQMYMVINILKKDTPYNDVRVRKALNYAIDKQAIIDQILFKGAGGKPIASFLSPAIIGEDPSLKPYPYDPQKAKDLLTEAGYPNGIDAEILYPTGRYVQGKEVVEAIANYYNKVGIKTKVTPMEQGTWQSMRTQHQLFPMNLTTYRNSDYDGYGQTFGAFSTGAGWSDYTNAELDKLLDESKAITDPEKRKEHWRKVNRLLYDDAAAVYLYEDVFNFAMKSKVDWKPLQGGDYMSLKRARLK